MKHKFLFLLLAFLLTAAHPLFAGTAKVRFGAYPGSEACSGTGICQISATTGASVTFDNMMKSAGTGGTEVTLTITFNYDEAVANGFTGDAKGGTYKFTGGYPFNHPQDQATGVPANYMIPMDFIATYAPKDAEGNITFTIKLARQY